MRKEGFLHGETDVIVAGTIGALLAKLH